MVNHKPTLWKVIVSLVVGTVSGIVVLLNQVTDGPANYYLRMQILSVVALVGIAGIIYFIWSRNQQ